MARMKFICDAERCIECNGCVTACKQENEVPWGVNRRRVVTINDGVVGADRARRGGEHRHDLRLRPDYLDAGNQDHAVRSGEGIVRKMRRSSHG